MWELIIYKGTDTYKSEHATQGAAFARLKMLYPNPSRMSAYKSETYIDFRFKDGEQEVMGAISRKEGEDMSEDDDE